MENPKCPYCGGEMRYAFIRNGDIDGTHFLICETCMSRSPAVSFDDDPYAAAMKRDRAKGEWKWNDDNGYYYCSECGAVSPREDQDGEYIDCPRYCPNCGADMRKEENDER